MLRVAARVAAVVLAVAQPGCFSKPPEPHASNGDGGVLDIIFMDAAGGIDAAQNPGDGAVCGTDTFDGGGPACGTWGTPLGNATTTRAGGYLSVSALAGQAGGCKTNGTFSFQNGASVEIVQPMNGGMDYTTSFVVFGASGELARVDLHEQAGVSSYSIQCSGTAPMTMSGAAKRWWRIRPYQSGSTIVESGPDPSSYAMETVCAGASATVVSVQLSASAGAADDATVPALFDNFDTMTICPQ
ncbi:MAG TPA: hypothetical protein VLB44_22775 [Kofleriaceae bacterium]|nr:hypothetical protein [Kofleriaceae bacterium]